jgi:hypothetical protein
MFLERVIDDFFDNYSNFPSENIIFVTPFRRTSLFLKKIYTQNINEASLLPEFITLDNLLERISGIKKLSDIQGLFELYNVYKENNTGDIDGFDKFIGWGKLLWKDFNDIDYYLIAEKDIFPYMEAIKQAEHWSLGEELTEIQQKHLDFWRSLGTYYTKLKDRMLELKQGYQGFIARKAVEKKEDYLEENSDKLYLFVGFNSLTKSEGNIIQYFLEEKRADIYWDIENPFLKNEHSAGFFIKNYLNRWKYYSNTQKITPKWINEDKNNPIIKIYGTPKHINQVHLLTNILEKIPTNELEKTAIVLSDSDMLLPLLQAIDTHKLPINITMGYPLQQTPIHDLFLSFFKLYISGKWYHKEVKSLLLQPFLSNLFSEKYKKQTITFINEHNLIYISKEHLKKYATDSDKALIDLLFSHSANSSVKDLIENVIELLFYIKDLLEKENELNRLNLEYLYNFYELFNQIRYLQEKFGFIQDPKSLYYIYNDLLAKQKLNFRGEPLEGLQIMGILEAQNIHFENIFLTSLNEGIFPKGKSTNSMIPFDVRKNIELPTYKEEDYAYSYYFYRILEHSNKAFLFYNTDTSDNLKGNEKSRFILQLIADYNVNPIILSPQVLISEKKSIEISKNNAIIQKLTNIATGEDPVHKRGFSSSALTSYILNPISFYQQQILDFRDEKEVEEIIELRTFGDIIHKILEKLYTPYIGKILLPENIAEMKEKVPSLTKETFIYYQKNNDITGKNIFILKTIEEYIYKFLSLDEKKVSKEKVEILYLETKILVDIQYEEFKHPFRFNGTIDRIEKRNNTIHIVDYKTGKVYPSQVTLLDEQWNFLISDFKYSKAFQLLMYAYLLKKSGIISNKSIIYAGNYSFKNLKNDFLYFKTDKKEICNITDDILKKFESKLIELLTEIYDITIPFREKE